MRQLVRVKATWRNGLMREDGLGKRVSACTLFLLGLLFQPVLVAEQTQKRPLTPDDLSRLEELGRPYPFCVAISPDAESVAYVLTRSALSSSHFGFKIFNFDRADIWIARPRDGQALNITEGAKDDSGFWWPHWSPDGRRLAMLSTRGGNVRVWVWNKDSGRLDMLSERAIPASWDLQWLSNDELAFSVLPGGAKPSLFEKDHRIAELTSQKWATAWKGREPTASVLESGVGSSIDRQIKEQLLVVNVATKRERIVATGLHFQDFRLSPDHRFLSYLRQVDVWQPDPHQIPETHFIHELYQLEIMQIGEGFVTKALTGVSDVSTARIGWSADSSEIAVLGYAAATHAPSDEVQVFRCNVSQATCRPASGKISARESYAANRVTQRGVLGRGFLWCGKHDLLVYGRPQGVTPESNQRQMKWWAIDEEGNSRDFFAEPKVSPNQVLTESNQAGVVGIVDGSIWRFDGAGHSAQNLTAHFSEKITSIEWGQSWATSIQSVESVLVFGVHRQSATALFSLDLKSGAIAPLEKPSVDAELAAYDAKTKLGIFVANNRTGTFLWLKTPEHGSNSAALETNTFLRDVFESELQKVEYRGLDGQNLKAWIILPFGFQAGKRYPVVTYVYEGLMYGDEPPTFQTHINDTTPLNLQLLASHGYVVLLPSMPRKPLGEEADAYLELTKGVLPAVDKLIELGIADAKRIGVMGHSYGGYSTYGLITQTTRFNAAVSLAGYCDLVSAYGTFDARERYTPFAQEDLFRIVQIEADMGNPPWKDAGRYFRNSPISFIDRVQTPLLIIQGDLDYVPIQQGEECFTALYRQNKRARFVRYWGEDHVFESPANIRDMWQQVYAWFDEFLKADVVPGGSSSSLAADSR